ncbi:MAG TPA: valine--tRNA ligase [Blastocatellia bacterium]|nr:valine--tRNA ligase [Blastocatellia bacterium]
MTLEMAKAYNPHEVEDRWYPFWESRGYFRPEVHPEGKPFAVVLPPPNVTGRLHIGHALNHTLQDVLVRWRRMQGYAVLWVPGTDHAGIATQVVVERHLAAQGLTRQDLGREEFERRVWQWRAESGGTIQQQMRREGISVDWSREAFTLDEPRSRAVREAFVRLYEAGLIYRGDYIINWCPRCQTALSDLEAPKKEVRGKLYYIAYPVKSRGSSSTTSEHEAPSSLVVATTRPETMLGDTAVAVHPQDARYRHLIGATALLPLVGRELPIIADERVDAEFGTGVVKVTPAHDPVDYEIGRTHGLSLVVAIDRNGRMTEAAGRFAGLDRYEARHRLVEALAEAGQLVRVEDYTHSVGHCQRCDTVIEPLVSTQWFVHVKPLAEQAIAAVAEGRTRILPENWTKTYFDWLENIRDWCISRQLWWGHRIPAWYCRANHITVARETPPACTQCGDTQLVQDEDVLDTWFSSALWPLSTLGWPDDTPELRRFYPTAVLVTAFDILFFWVARMMMMGLAFMKDHPSRTEAIDPDAVPFRLVLIHGLVRDPYGQKMSKTRGNTVDPLEMFERYGTDAVRYTLVAAARPGNDVTPQYSKLETYRNFCNKIWNAARFALLNCTPEDVAGAREGTTEELPLVDRWVRSKLTRTIAEVTQALEEFRFHEAALALYHFFWHDFCDWYIELTKATVTAPEDSAERRAARARLVSVLETSLRLLHPFMPFITEEVWQRLPHEGETICLAPYPVADRSALDPEAERQMGLIIDLIKKIRNVRAVMNIDHAAWLDLLVRASSDDAHDLVVAHRDHIRRLARVNRIEFVPTFDGLRHVARDVAGDVELAIPLEGIIDFERERERLQRALEKAEKELNQLQQRLNNPDFLARAPEDVVAETRERHEELTERREKLVAILRSL